MADIKSPEERSRNMSMIRDKDTKPEVYIRKKLFESGFRYRKNAKYVIGIDMRVVNLHTRPRAELTFGLRNSLKISGVTNLFKKS